MNQQLDTSALQVDAGFNIPDPTSVSRLEGKVSETEWHMRKQLAATYPVSYTHLTLPTILLV